MQTLTALLLGLTMISVPLMSNDKGTEKSPAKPRIVVLTDISTWETDDSESLVRLLAHADMLEIEGLVFTTGYSMDKIREDFLSLIHDAINAYEKDLPNLMKRSGQESFLDDESKQSIGYWPSADYLRERTVVGSKNMGMKFIGEGNISDGSNLIIDQADEKDDRPLWIAVWGGGNTMAQAVWQVQQERSEEELKSFLHKLRTYTITDQDAPNIFAVPAEEREERLGEILAVSSHQWLRKEFENDLMFLWDECAWKHHNGTGKKNWDQYAEHIQGHGHLGKEYPKYKYGVEGDTPSFLYLLPNGLSNPEVPGQIGWGGYFEWGPGPDEITNAYNNHTGNAYNVCSKYFKYFYPAAFNNFAARMDWASTGKGNRNPVISINGDTSLDIINLKTKSGKKVKLDASETYDPDGDQLTYKWWVIPAEGSFKGEVTINGNTNSKAVIEVPEKLQGKPIHIICEVTDDGTHNLTSYRRIILSSK